MTQGVLIFAETTGAALGADCQGNVRRRAPLGRRAR